MLIIKFFVTSLAFSILLIVISAIYYKLEIAWYYKYAKDIYNHFNEWIQSKETNNCCPSHYDIEKILDKLYSKNYINDNFWTCAYYNNDTSMCVNLVYDFPLYKVVKGGFIDGATNIKALHNSEIELINNIYKIWRTKFKMSQTLFFWFHFIVYFPDHIINFIKRYMHINTKKENKKHHVDANFITILYWIYEIISGIVSIWSVVSKFI